MADNDMIAIGSMQAMKECGYDVPQPIVVKKIRLVLLSWPQAENLKSMNSSYVLL